MGSKKERNEIEDFIPDSLNDNLKVHGQEIVDNLGEDLIKEVVFNVLCGENLRNSTETLTKKRISKISSSLLASLIKASSKDNDFIGNLPKIALRELKKTKNKHDRWIFLWALGLTDKGFQNILRDSKSDLDKYASKYDWELEKLSKEALQNYGVLTGNLSVDKFSTSVNWRFMIHLMGIIGSQTLAIRGSEKSTYGKLFEKLILGTTLSLFGFKFINKDHPTNIKKNLFWLSERNEKRESDATVLCEPGKAIRFDIGFIGRGNPEISLDKVSRFERELEFGKEKYYVSTIILIDRIGEKSRIERLAKHINGTIIQMSMSYWPKQLAMVLRDKADYKSEILEIDESELKKYMFNKIKKINIKQFLYEK